MEGESCGAPYCPVFVLSCPIPSCFVSCPSLPYPVVLCVLSCSALPRPILSCPVLSCPVLSCPVLSCPVLSCPVLSYPLLSCLCCPVSCPVLPCPVLTCRVLLILLSVSSLMFDRARYIVASPTAKYNEPPSIFEAPCDVVFLCSKPNELSAESAAVIANSGCKTVVDGGYRPVSSAASEV